MKLIVKLLFFNVIVFFISLLFFSLTLPLYTNTPLTSLNYKSVMSDAMLISYGVCMVFTVAFFILSSSIVDEMIEYIER